MAIYDRDYVFQQQQRPGGLSFLTANTWIILINVAVFAIQIVLNYGMRVGDPISKFGWLSYDTSFKGLEFWRFITFQFLHSGMLHIFFNMLGLYVFGPIVEQQLGRQRYVAYYLATGIFGGVGFMLIVLLGALVPSVGAFLSVNQSVPLVGASAGVFGVIMACAYIAPNEVVTLMFPPIPLKMRTFAYAYVAIAAISIIMGAKNSGGEAAHLGGAIAGYFFIRNIHLLRDFFDVFGDSRKPKAASRSLLDKREPGKGFWGFGKKDGGKPSVLRPSAAEREVEEARKLGEEVDRILAKAKANGLHTLSEREKRTLQQATERLNKQASDRIS